MLDLFPPAAAWTSRSADCSVIQNLEDILLDPAYVVLQLIKPAPTRKTSGQRHVQSFTVNSLLDLNQELARWSVWVVWIIDNPEWQYLCGPGCSLKHWATDQVFILTHEWQQVCFSLTVFWFSPPQSRFHTCLFAGLSAGSHKSYWTDFHQTGTADGSQPRIDPVHFWCGSR